MELAPRGIQAPRRAAREAAPPQTERAALLRHKGHRWRPDRGTEVSLLSRLEQALERAVEGLFPAGSGVPPLEIARALAASMEREKQVSVRRTYVPNEYKVLLNQADLAVLEGVKGRLEQEFSEYLGELTVEREYTAQGRPQVMLAGDEAVGIGQIRVEAAFAERTRCELDFHAGADSGRRVVVQGRAVLGRSAEADVALGDDSVSRRHAVIEFAQGGFTVRDLGSTNGTFVNGESVKEAELEDGDLLRLGLAEAVFRVL